MTTDAGDAEALVERYLALFAAGEIEAAARLLTPDAVLVFPGGTPQTSLPDVAAEVDRLYEKVAKRIDRTWTATTPDGLVVTTTGHLYGTSRTAGDFDDVRFIDFFTIRDGRIAAQEVINDAAAVGVVPPYRRTAADF